MKIGILVAVVVVLIVVGAVVAALFILGNKKGSMPSTKYELMEINLKGTNKDLELEITLTLKTGYTKDDCKRKMVGLKFLFDETCLPFREPIEIQEPVEEDNEKKENEKKITFTAAFPKGCGFLIMLHLKPGPQKEIDIGYILSPDDKDKCNVFTLKANIKHADLDLDITSGTIPESVISFNSEYKFDKIVEAFEVKIKNGWAIPFTLDGDDPVLSKYRQVSHRYYLENEPEESVNAAFWLYSQDLATITAISKDSVCKDVKIPEAQLKFIVEEEKKALKACDISKIKDPLRAHLDKILKDK